jgi:chromosome condensin MukBEF MukE localization factor
MLEMPPFTTTKLQEERDSQESKVFTIRMSKDELKEFEEAARTLQQEKVSTTIKQLARLGMLVLHDKKTLYVLETVFKNKRNNERIGIVTPQPDFVQM